jgi:formylmethanofuran dehydrogenase subunit E
MYRKILFAVILVLTTGAGLMAQTNDQLRADPRVEIKKDIADKNTEALMLKAGQLHGHFCPGLAMGVMAATYAIEHLNLDVNQMDGLKVIAEARNCLTDGIQFVTGCSFGKESLIYQPTDEVVFTFYRKDGKGIRIKSRDDSPEVIKKSLPDTATRAFGTLNIPMEQLFIISEVEEKKVQ